MPPRPQPLVTLVWVAAGLCWVVELTLPWTSAGTLSTTSLSDAIALVRGGGVEAAVPGSVAAAALVLPFTGALLAVVAGAPGRVGAGARVVLAAAGTTAVIVAVRVVPQGDAGLGPGGRTAFAGCVLVLAALGWEVVTWLRTQAHPRSRRTTPSRLALAVALASVVAGVLMAGHVGWQAVRHPVGAETPEAAARALVAAVVERDAVAALAVAAPDEVDEVVEAFVALRDDTRDPEDPDDAGDGGPGLTDAVSFEVDVPATEVEPDGRDRAVVTLTGGAYEIRVDLEAVPGPFEVLEVVFPDGRLGGDLGDLTGSPLARLLGLDERLSMTVERVDGRWFVTGLGPAIDRVAGVLLGDDLAGLVLGGLTD